MAGRGPAGEKGSKDGGRMSVQSTGHLSAGKAAAAVPAATPSAPQLLPPWPHGHRGVPALSLGPGVAIGWASSAPFLLALCPGSGLSCRQPLNPTEPSCFPLINF